MTFPSRDRQAGGSLIGRMIGAASFNVDVYEEVEADRSAMGQAVLVVVLVAVVNGVVLLANDGGVDGLVFGIIGSLLTWAVWAGITMFVGTTIFNTPETHADWGQLARTTGFAQSPGVLGILGVIPFLGVLVLFAIPVWRLATMVVAVRQALDYTSTLRAVGVVVVGFIPVLVVQAILFNSVR